MLILSNVLALALIAADEPGPPQAPCGVESGEFKAKADAQEVWHLTLPEAIRIGLENSEVVRVISLGAQGLPVVGLEPAPSNPGEVGVEPPAAPGIVIARLNADASIWNFKAAIMAHVRSIEQQYWALCHEQVTLWSRETAVKLGEEILRRERAELEAGRSNTANVAEAAQQLENFRLNLATATSDVITTEKQLRNILGLPAFDNRRIVPDTAPIEARVEPDWEVSVREMIESQPDLVQQKVLVRLTELRLLLARNQLLPRLTTDALREFGNLGHFAGGIVPGLENLIGQVAARRDPDGPGRFEPRDPEFIAGQVGLTLWTPNSLHSPLANTRQAQYQLLRQRAFLQQITHESTHTLARFFLEVDANYKQFRTAQRLRADAQERLEAQRAFYEEGRITLDRLLDAVARYANALAQESLYKSTYNTSIAALEEAKGTLLAYDKITVLDGPAPRKHDDAAKVDAVVQAAFEAPAASPPAKAPPAATTYKLRAKLGGVKFLEVEVEINTAPAARP